MGTSHAKIWVRLSRNTLTQARQTFQQIPWWLLESMQLEEQGRGSFED